MSASEPAPAQYAYDEDLDALVVAVRGERSYEAARAHFKTVVARLEAEATERLLLDLTEANYAFDIEQAIERFAEIAADAEGKQIALVMDVSQREKGLIMQTLGTVRWNLVRLFHDTGAARRWLEDTRD